MAAAAASEEKSVQIEIQGNDDVDQGKERDEKTVPVISISDAVDQSKEKEEKIVPVISISDSVDQGKEKGVQTENLVISCKTVDQCKEQLKKGVNSKKPVVIYFTASWCGPCRVIGPIFSDIAKEIPDAIFLKVDVDELQAVAEEYKVEAMPTFVFLKDGKEVGKRLVGAKKEELREKIFGHCSSNK